MARKSIKERIESMVQEDIREELLKLGEKYKEISDIIESNTNTIANYRYRSLINDLNYNNGYIEGMKRVLLLIENMYTGGSQQ